MGIVKSQWLEQEERGWSDPGTWVCQSCIGQDSHLRQLVRKNLGGVACSYCTSKTRKAAPLVSLMDAVLRGVKYSYSDEANAGCPYDKDFNIEYMPSDNVLRQVLDSEGIEWPERLVTDVAKAFINTGWVDAPDGDWMGSYHHERLHWSWTSFADAVMHRSRFHFQVGSRVRRYGDDLLGVHEVLPFLGQLVRQSRMVRKLPMTTVLHRIRPGKHTHCIADLGPPPKDKASAGRMNPAGIPYMYLAFAEKTALAETRVASGQQVTVSRWSPQRDLQVIDLTHFSSSPSIFSEKKREYDMIQFLYAFRDEISMPVAHDGSEHIGYVPTQVVSEYFAQAFTYSSGKRVDGLIYPSAVESEGKNLVLFPRYEDASAVMSLKESRVGHVDFSGRSVV